MSKKNVRKVRKSAPCAFKYYFYRDENNSPRMTICIAQSIDGTYSRGISICSLADVVSKVEGKKWARKRALSGHYSGKTKEPIKRGFSFQIGHPFSFKTQGNAYLTAFEKGLFKETV